MISVSVLLLVEVGQELVWFGVGWKFHYELI